VQFEEATWCYGGKARVQVVGGYRVMQKTIVSICFTALVLTTPAAHAEAVGEFYQGKTLTAIVGNSPGGGFDVLTRLVARFIGKYIPGHPSVIVQNMPGAGTLLAANYLYSIAPKDGTVFGLIQRNMPMLALLGQNPNVRFDPRKFNWLGSSSDFSDDAYVLIARKDAPAQSVEQMLRMDRPLMLLGGTADGSSSADVPKILRDTVGLNFKLVLGYTATPDLFLAMERNEINCRMVELSSIKATKADWLKPDSAYRLLLQYARPTRLKEFPDVPTARELALNDEARELIEFTEAPLLTMAWPFTAPPGIPDDRVKALRDAFAAVHRDPQFLSEAETAHLDINPIGPEAILASINTMAQARPEIFDYVRKLMTGKNGG
jgi:tripartite-type tricarboxylate transporter receptor subunit TctC